MIADTLLKLLCCPETHQALAPANAELVDALKQQIAAGKLRNRAGKPVTEKMSEALLRADGKYAYPVVGDVPILLVDEAIPVTR